MAEKAMLVGGWKISAPGILASTRRKSILAAARAVSINETSHRDDINNMSPIQTDSTLLTSPAAVLGLLAFLILTLAVTQAYRVLASPLSRLPGPAVSKWTNLRLQLAVLCGHRVTYVHELHQRYGPVVRISPTEVSLADKSAVRALYKTGSPFVKSEWYKTFVGDKKDFSLFTETDRKAHANHRRIVAANFTERWIKNLEPYIAQNVQLAVQRMADEERSRGYTDLFKWFTFMATDVIGEASFGESFQLLQIGKKTQYVEDMEMIGRRGVLRAELPMLVSLIAKLPLKSAKNVQQAVNRVLEYGEQSILRYRAQVRANPETVKPTLLTKEYAQVDDGVMTESMLRRDAAGYIVAGTDTTALTATYAVWLLNQHPDIERDLIREISTVPPVFNDDDLRHLPVLNGVLNETLRLRSPLSQSLPRVVPPTGAEFNGWFIPGGTTVGIQAWTMHRDPTIWQDPEAFRPSRWISPTRDMKDCFLAFGGGSRVCIGMHFAQLELRHALTNFYRTFESGVKASSAEGFTDRDMQPLSYLMLPPKGGRCLVQRRKW